LIIILKNEKIELDSMSAVDTSRLAGRSEDGKWVIIICYNFANDNHYQKAQQAKNNLGLLTCNQAYLIIILAHLAIIFVYFW